MGEDFEFYMPLVKNYDGAEGKDGYYHIAVAIASGKKDLQGDQMTKNALEQIVHQAKGINVDGSQLPGINIDDNHIKGLNAIVGPVTDSWLEDDKVMIDLRVRNEWEKTVKDLVDSGVHLGGSIRGRATERLPPVGSAKGQINGVFIRKAALTDEPAAWDTRGTQRTLEKSVCARGLCSQIEKSIDELNKSEEESKEVKDDTKEIAVLNELNEALLDGIKTIKNIE